MSNKVVLVICDGLGDDFARERMGYLEHLVEERRATRYTSRAVLPTMSRPNYETLHTGVVPAVHGIVSNGVVRKSNLPNIFRLAKQGGLVTAAVAFFWVSELYHESPYDPVRHIEYDYPEAGITHGRFYVANDEPDSETLTRGVSLARRFDPSYLLVHPMGVDLAGHRHGRDSGEYNRAVTYMGDGLARAVPAWLDLGYSVLVTADHGHDAHKQHGGTTDDVRNVPLYAIRPDGSGLGIQDQQASQLQVAPTV
ncbi:MAG TPA: alkaline phosphatase family protein, partial [Actinobacteria bacterium]|nr:alkaline phosphatase family protein [Actinomycetota bacterium]